MISGWPNWASSDAMMKSHSSASSQPPPRAKPLTAAMMGFADQANLVPGRQEIVHVEIGEGFLRHLGDVGAGRKGARAAGDDDGAHPVVGIELLQRIQGFLGQLPVQRVQRIWDD